jgi:hypothetical protein
MNVTTETQEQSSARTWWCWVWHIQRTLLFWIVGAFNTVFIRPEDVGTWKHAVGWLLIVLAAVDTVALAARVVKSLRDRSREPHSS